MTLLNILHYPDNKLRQKGHNIDTFDEKLEKIATDMLETMYQSKGIDVENDYAPVWRVSKDKKDIISECIKMVREKVGPVAAFKIAIVVKRLPKTRSGKVLRGTVRKIADNEPYKMPATIDDPVILDEIKADLVENKILKL